LVDIQWHAHMIKTDTGSDNQEAVGDAICSRYDPCAWN